jgi:hypothetical protein
MVFMGDETSLKDRLQNETYLNDERLSRLVKVLEMPGFARYHTVHQFGINGHPKPIVDNTSMWNRVTKKHDRFLRTSHFEGVEAGIGHIESEWLAIEDGINPEDSYLQAMGWAMSKRQLELALVGSRSKDGSSILTPGLSTLKGAQTVDIDMASASEKDIVQAVLEAKKLAIRAGAMNRKGFRVLLPMEHENKIKEFYNTAGTVTGEGYLEGTYGIQVVIDEDITTPIVYQYDAGDMYFHRWAGAKLGKPGINPETGEEVLRASMSGAWLVVADEARIVYLKKK